MSRVIKKEVLSLMKENGGFRNEGFRLHDGFTTEYEIKDVIAASTRNAKKGEKNTYRVNCKSDKGSHSIHGFLMSNALLVPKDIKLKTTNTVKKGVKSIYYYEDIQDVITSSKYVNTVFDDKVDFEFPEKFEIIGAVVSKDSEGDHPYVPLNRYPFYNVFLRHHKISDTTATYVDKDTINMYINETGPRRPVLPTDFKFELPNHEEAVWKVTNWNPTLLIRAFDE